MLRPIWKSRNLLLNLVRRDLTVRYKSTVLGFFWSFAKPLAYMGIYHVVFGQILAVKVEETRIPYSLHVLAGILPWTFFTAATSAAMYSIVSSANLIKKVKLPLEVFPLAAALSQAIHFALALAVIIAVMLPFGLAPGPAFLLLPLVAAVQFVLVLAVSLLLASLNVFYRDVSSIWEVLLAAWFYVTPILYPAYRALRYFEERGWGWARALYMLNPMGPITLAYRRIILYSAIDGPAKEYASDAGLAGWLGVVALVSLGALAAAHALFTRLSRRFADEL